MSEHWNDSILVDAHKHTHTHRHIGHTLATVAKILSSSMLS